MVKKEGMLKEKTTLNLINKLKMSKAQLFAILTALSSTVLIVSNLASTKMFDFFGTGLVWDGGAILFPLSYILGDIITEIFGFKCAKKIIWTAFAMNLIAVGALFIVQMLPPGLGWENQEAYETIIGFMPRIVAGSLIAFVCGQILNSYVFVKIKEMTNGKRFWQRAIGSSLVGDLVDTVIFTTIAFIGTISTMQFVGLLIIAYVSKIVGETVLLPVTYGAVDLCKKLVENEKNEFNFEINAEIPDALGRAGIIHTPHGDIKTPTFVVVGTYGEVRFLSQSKFHKIGLQAMISNGFHLSKISDEIEQKGGLYKYSGYNCPTITDSGGFQIMSFGSGLGKVVSMDKRNIAREQFKTKYKNRLARVTEEGVYFKMHKEDHEKLFTPEYSMEFQHKIGADIIMAFDELTNIGDSRKYNEEALDRTHRWGIRCLAEHQKLTHERVNKPYQALYGVLQGAHYQDLREKAARELGAMDFDGYGLGGAFEKEHLSDILFWTNKILPDSKPRHLLGLSKPDDIFVGVENGCDTFDCVAPTREARHGKIYTIDGDINIRNAKFADDPLTLSEGCQCPTCKSGYSREEIRKLLKNKDGKKTDKQIVSDKQLALELITIHNVYFIVKLTEEIRNSIIDENFFNFRDKWLKRYYK